MPGSRGLKAKGTKLVRRPVTPSVEARIRGLTSEGMGIVVLRDGPRILWIDDAEVVGDGRRELREFLRHGFPQEGEHRLGVIAEFCETIAVRDVFVHHEPEPFDWVEMRTVGRHEVQDDLPSGHFQPLLDEPGVVVAGVVEVDVDPAHVRVGPFEGFEQADGALRIDGQHFDDAGHASFEVDCAMQIEPLTARGCGDRAAIATGKPAAAWV